MIRRIRQEIAFSTARVAGCYRHGDVFQIRPMHPDAETLDSAIGHFPFLLEFSYSVPSLPETSFNPELPAALVEPMIDQDAADRAKKWILLILGVVSKARIFQYFHRPTEQMWFLGLPKGPASEAIPHHPQWGQPGYNHKGITAWLLDDFSSPDQGPIAQVRAEEYYRTETPQQYVVGKTSSRFELPDRVEDILMAYHSLPDPEKLPFLSACFLFDKSIDLFWEAPSLAFTASVSSLETLIAADHRGEIVSRCQCCGQPEHRVRQKFLAFIKTYGSDTPAARKYADRIYERRCSVLHEGQLSPGEADVRTIDGAIEWIADDDSRRSVIRFFRACILNWLMLHSQGANKAL